MTVTGYSSRNLTAHSTDFVHRLSNLIVRFALAGFGLAGFALAGFALLLAMLSVTAMVTADTGANPTLSTQLPVAAQPPLRIVLGQDLSGDQCQGLTGAVLREALTVRNGITFQCDSMPWARAQMMLKSAERDALVALPTDERAAYTRAGTEPVISARLMLFTHANHAQLAAIRQIKTLADAKPFRVMSYRGDGWAQQQLGAAGVAVEWSEDSSTVLRKLVSGRGDLYFQTDKDTWAQIKQLQLTDSIVALPTEFGLINRHLLIRSGSAYVADLPRIDAALQAMKKDGSWAKLYRQYQ